MSVPTDISALLLRHVRQAPRLDEDQERDLVARYRDGDQAAFGILILSNVRLAIRRAHALRGYGLPTDDVVQEGIIGLLEAADRFDPDRETRFATYAAWWVKALTTEFLLRNWSIVRTVTSGEQKALFFKVRQMRARLERDPAADPSTVRAAIAAALGTSTREVELMEARLSGDVYLNAPAPWAEDGEAEIGDSFADEKSLLSDVAAIIDDDEREVALHHALDSLDERERLIIDQRWLTESVAPLCALAEYLEVSTSVVKRIEVGALAKMQAMVACNRTVRTLAAGASATLHSRECRVPIRLHSRDRRIQKASRLWGQSSGRS